MPGLFLCQDTMDTDDPDDSSDREVFPQKSLREMSG
jgi:hypothetical protein